jgi:hypothetical protein
MASYADDDMSMGFNFIDDLDVSTASNTYSRGLDYHDMADTESNADYDQVCLLVYTQRTNTLLGT